MHLNKLIQTGTSCCMHPLETATAIAIAGARARRETGTTSGTAARAIAIARARARARQEDNGVMTEGERGMHKQQRHDLVKGKME